MKYNLIQTIALLLMPVINIFSQTSLPYYTGFDNNIQQAGWQEYRKGATGTYHWGFNIVNSYTSPNCLYHDYPVGGTSVTDDWFVSPTFNFSSGGKIDSLRIFAYGFGTPGTNDTLAMYILTNSPDPELATSKTLLYDFRGTNYPNTSNPKWEIRSDINIPATVGTSFIAIKYKTTNNWLTVKFDNIKISGNNASGIQKKSYNSDDITLYPNPASQDVCIKFNNKLFASGLLLLNIYDSTGKLVVKENIYENESLNTDLINGIYFYTIENINKTHIKSGKLIINK